MACIRISRTDQYTNRLRSYRLFLNGKPLGKIANSETKEFIVPAGAHTLQAKVWWSSSPSVHFHLDDGSEKVFLIGGFKGAAAFLLIMTVLAALQLAFVFFDQTKWLAVLLLLIFYIIGIFQSFSRKWHLQLTETISEENTRSAEEAFAP